MPASIGAPLPYALAGWGRYVIYMGCSLRSSNLSVPRTGDVLWGRAVMASPDDEGLYRIYRGALA